MRKKQKERTAAGTASILRTIVLEMWKKNEKKKREKEKRRKKKKRKYMSILKYNPVQVLVCSFGVCGVIHRGAVPAGPPFQGAANPRKSGLAVQEEQPQLCPGPFPFPSGIFHEGFPNP